MVELTKGLILDKDLDAYDGTLATSRTSSSGGTTSGLKIGDAVDVLRVFGSSDTDNQTRATIASATGALGSTNIALVFRPGTWTIDDDLTIGSNFTLVVPAGCVFDVAAGKTLTIQGVLFRQHSTYSSGSGTVTVSGTDLLATSSPDDDYAVDTGAADAYVVSLDSSPSSYTAGMVVRFKPANDNTGASTINVNSLGNKDIKKQDGSTDVETGDIIAGQIVTLIYEGTNGVFHIDTEQQDLSQRTALTSPATGDLLEITDVGTGNLARRKITLTNLFKVIDSFTEDTSPDLVNDEILTYDNNASTVKKVAPTNLDTLTSGTVDDLSSGSPTESDFTSIPSWVQRITVIFKGVSLSGTDHILVQLGDSGGFESSGYVSTSILEGGNTANTSSTSGFVIAVNNAARTFSGHMTITNIDSNDWVSSHAGKIATDTISTGGGDKSLSGTLDRVRITRTGTDTFDAGTVNVYYE